MAKPGCDFSQQKDLDQDQEDQDQDQEDLQILDENEQQRILDGSQASRFPAFWYCMQYWNVLALRCSSIEMFQYWVE